jgi:tRNA (adenine22-N1)-methyltransferase
MLPARLQSILDNIPEDVSVADIGSDHAYIPIGLWKRGNPGPIIATEVKKGPYNQALKSILDSNAEVELRLGDGLEPIKSGEVDWIVIAGMGGHTIMKILEQSETILPSFKAFLLQPMFKTEELRKKVVELGLFIQREWVVNERKKCYDFMIVVPDYKMC